MLIICRRWAFKWHMDDQISTAEFICSWHMNDLLPKMDMWWQIFIFLNNVQTILWDVEMGSYRTPVSVKRKPGIIWTCWYISYKCPRIKDILAIISILSSWQRTHTHNEHATSFKSNNHLEATLVLFTNKGRLDCLQNWNCVMHLLRDRRVNHHNQHNNSWLNLFDH